MREHHERLDEVRKAFALWRDQKRYSTQPIPESLWQQAIDLAEFFPMPRIAVTLKVSIHSLEKKIALLAGAKQGPPCRKGQNSTSRQG